MKNSVLGILLLTTAAFSASEPATRIEEAAKVFKEVMAIPEKEIPRELLEKAECVAIVPGLKKGGFIVGAQYGKGVMTCRTASGWSGPSTIRIEGGSIGAQIGAGESDVVLVVMNKGGAEKLMKSEFTIGGEAGAMAGPVGRNSSAKTDAYLNAQILSYARSRGAFAGITLNGATLRSDDKDNAELYGKAVTHKDILMGVEKAPAAASPLMAAIRPYVMGGNRMERTRTKK